MSRARILGFALRGAALAAALAFGTAASAPAQPRLTTLRLGAIPNDDMTSVLYAMKTGMFAKAGLDVQVQKQTSGVAIAAAVAGGTYDIGKSSITPIIDAHEKGLPFVIVAPAAIYEASAPYGGMIVAKDSPIKTGKDLDGKVVGINSLNDIGQAAIDAWIEKTGGDWHAVHYVEVPMSASGAAIEQGRIVAGENVYPQLATDLASGKIRLIPAFSAVAPRFLFSVWFTTTAYARAHPEAVDAFARTVAKAAAYTNAHPAQTAGMVADLTGIPLETVQHMTRVYDGTELRMSELQPAIDASVRYGMLARSFPARELLSGPLIAK